MRKFEVENDREQGRVSDRSYPFLLVCSRHRVENSHVQEIIGNVIFGIESDWTNDTKRFCVGDGSESTEKIFEKHVEHI